MPKAQGFTPEWSSPPGETIAELLGLNGITTEQFADQLSISKSEATELLQGRRPITVGVARDLSRLLGGTVEFWMTRDHQYREDVRRQLSSERSWLKEIPVSDMVSFGWIAPGRQTGAVDVEVLLRFFDVKSTYEWRKRYSRSRLLAAFRTSPTFDSQLGAVAAWLRRAEIVASGLKCSSWNPIGFGDSLTAIRHLTRQKDPKAFLPKLSVLCSANGVALAVVRCPAGCRASGATKFLSEDRALLLLSFRHLTDDHFWFTFFHEAAHLLLHGTNSVFIEGLPTKHTTEEREANDFAANCLIPATLRPDLTNLDLDVRSIIRFSTDIGISPGIVVGQLQHHGRLRRNQLNGLKRRYVWDSA